MKKIVGGIVITVFLLAYSTGYADSSSNKPVDWHNNYFLNIKLKNFDLFKGHDKLLLAEKEEQQLAMRENNEAIQVLSEKIIVKANSEIEDYHRSYLSRLVEIETMLDNSNFNVFAESKQEEIQSEIEQDLAEYLSDLLSE